MLEHSHAVGEGRRARERGRDGDEVGSVPFQHDPGPRIPQWALARPLPRGSLIPRTSPCDPLYVDPLSLRYEAGDAGRGDGSRVQVALDSGRGAAHGVVVALTGRAGESVWR
jgi:hypothetical protein